MRPVAAVAGDAGVPQWVFRLRRYAFLGDGSIAAVYSSPAGTTLLVHAADGTTRALPAPGTWLAAPVAAGRCPLPDGRLAHRLPRRGAGRSGHRRRPGCIRAPEGPGLDPAFVSIPERVAFPTPDGPRLRLLLPAGEPRLPGAGRRPAAAAGHHPRRPHRRRPAGARPRGAVLDQPRLRPGRRGLRRVHRLRPGLLGAPPAAPGAWWTCGTAPWPPPTWPPPAGPTRPAWPSAAAAPAGTPPWRPWPSATSSPPGPATSAWPTWSCWPGTPTSSSRATSTGWSVPYPEAQATYRERSPIHHLDGIDRPVILFQGLEDRVVPPQQAEIMAAALRGRGVPVAPSFRCTFPGGGGRVLYGGFGVTAENSRRTGPARPKLSWLATGRAGLRQPPPARAGDIAPPTGCAVAGGSLRGKAGRRPRDKRAVPTTLGRGRACATLARWPRRSPGRLPPQHGAPPAWPDLTLTLRQGVRWPA